MDQEFWYRCVKCGYMFTPQQYLALVQLRSSQSGEKESELLAAPERVPCRNRGCIGHLSQTDSEFKEAR